MIQILASEKGEGKTKKLLEMANDLVKKVDGHIVYIDDDKRNMYDLQIGIRFVETSGFVMKNLEVLFGFVCGILSQDSDVEKIFVDGLHNIVKEIDNDSLTAFLGEVEKLSKEANVDFIMSISDKVSDLPDKVKEYII
ncbi:MAG: hypothetical protein IAC55_01890 [Tyzzerella sp.]|uniref:Twitching motility protein PilT n=1 Tax=Candidatus Fimicola merdigallinarum TaxID=2840819 RepID=A0A9D9H2Z5_9FIRM|nr:hypothetical protein [Candidatus Fimicola merdigallinarum]